MANIQKYYSQVGVPSASREAPPAQNPIPEVINQSANLADQFYQRYKQAKYNTEKNEAILTIKKQVNAYQEAKRQNVELPPPGEDLVDFRTKDWEEYSKSINQDIINKISDPRLKEDIGNWWSNTSEELRSQVANSAIDENISIMAKKNQEFIDLSIEAGDFEGAKNVLDQAFADGLFSQTQAEDIYDYINFKSVIAQADQEDDLDKAQQIIDESDLDVEEKVKAKSYMTQRWKAREQEIKIAKNQYSDQNFNDVYEAIITDNIMSEDELIRVLNNLPEAEYKGETIPGSKEEFIAKKIVTFNSALKARRNERESKSKGDDFEPDSVAMNDLDQTFWTGSRADMLEKLNKYYNSGKIDSEIREKYVKKMNSTAFPRMNDTGAKQFQSALSQLKKDKIITTPEEEHAIYQRWNDFIQSHSPEEIATEAYYNDLPEFIRGIRLERTTYDLNKLSEYLREVGNFNTKTEAEQFLNRGLMGDYTGQIDVRAIHSYISAPAGNIDELKNQVADYLFGAKDYDSLSKKQKAKVNLNAAMAVYTKNVMGLASKEIGPGGRAVIGTDGMPWVRYGEGDNEVTYRLGLNSDETEEEWYVYDNGSWVPAGIDIPKRDKPDNFATSAIKTLKSALKSASTEEDTKEIEITNPFTGEEGVFNPLTKQIGTSPTSSNGFLSGVRF